MSREDDIARELEAHLELEAEECREAGMSAEEARYAAMRAMGPAARIQEDTRAVWRSLMVEQLWRDVRYATRMLWRAPGFTLVAVLCLGLGIGASTTIFSVVNAVLFKPLPYRDSDRLVRVYSEFPTFPGGGLPKFPLSPVEFRELQRQGRAWDQIEGWVVQGANLAGGSEPIRINSTYVSGGMMSMLGVAPAFGRAIVPSDDAAGAPVVLMLSHGLWERAFAGDPKVVGREVYLDGSKATVIGVMPKGFEFPPGLAEASEAWIPTQFPESLMQRRGSHFFNAVAHLRPGLSLDASRQEVAGTTEEFGRRQSQNFHTLNRKQHPVVIHPFQSEVIGNVRTAMLMLLGAVAFFLLIACVNVASLLLARSDSRQREVAVRTAVGAGSAQLLRQFIVEGVILSAMGAVAGILIATFGVGLIISTNAGMIPRVREAGIDWQVLLFTVGVTFVTGILFGLTPGIHLIARSLNDSLRNSAGRTFGSVNANRFRGALVASELALALVLLIGAGLLVQAFWRLQRVDAGLRAENLVTMRVSLSNAAYNDQARLTQFWSTLSDRLANLPGIESGTAMTGLPPIRGANQNDTDIENFVPREGGPVQNVAYYQNVGDRFFETLGIRLVEGRFFDARDGSSAPRVAIVNHSMARTFWPGESALGKRVRPSGSKDWATIVGVVADVRNGGLDKPAGTELFLSARQGAGGRTAWITVRTRGNARDAVETVRRTVRDIDPSLPVTSPRTMDQVFGEAQSRPRFLALILTIFSTLSLVLAAFGIYGVISYSVTQRTTEFGIRMALGAQAGDVQRLVVREGAVLAVAGVVIGAAGALALTRSLEGLLFDISRFDVVTFGAMACLLAGVALVASWVPARRATAVDPIRALRYE